MSSKAKVVPISTKRPTTIEKSVTISKVYARGEVNKDGSCEWAFHVEMNGNQEGYSFATRKDAIKGRVMVQKMLKEKGFRTQN